MAAKPAARIIHSREPANKCDSWGSQNSPIQTSFSLTFSHDHPWQRLHLKDLKLKSFLWPKTQVHHSGVFTFRAPPSPAWIPWPLNSITIISIQDYPALRISSIHMLFNSQQCVNQSLFVLVLISISEHSLANSDRLSLYSGSFSHLTCHPFLL